MGNNILNNSEVEIMPNNSNEFKIKQAIKQWQKDLEKTNQMLYMAQKKLDEKMQQIRYYCYQNTNEMDIKNYYPEIIDLQKNVAKIMFYISTLEIKIKTWTDKLNKCV